MFNISDLSTVDIIGSVGSVRSFILNGIDDFESHEVNPDIINVNISEYVSTESSQILRSTRRFDRRTHILSD